MYWILYSQRKSLELTDNSLLQLGQLGHLFANLIFHLSLPPSMHNILELWMTFLLFLCCGYLW